MLKYIPRLWKKKGLPIHVIYHCTYSCNAACKTCFLWKEIAAKNVSKELSVDEIRQIRKTLRNILWLQIGGGEPFLREDLPQICAVFRDVHTIAIPTNCMEPKQIEAKTREILENISSRLFLALSMDGLGNRHDEIRGVEGNFDRVLETYKRVNKLRGRYPNLKIAVNTVIMQENEAEIEKVIGYVKRFFSVDMHAFEFLRGTPRCSTVSLPHLDRCREFVSLAKETIASYGYGGGFKGQVLKKAKLYEQDLILNTMEKNKKQIDCFAGRLSAVINPYGDVYACELINGRIGNIRDFGYDFRKLWSSSGAQDTRRKIRDCFCTHSCFYLINSLFNPAALARAILR